MNSYDGGEILFSKNYNIPIIISFMNLKSLFYLSEKSGAGSVCLGKSLFCVFFTVDETPSFCWLILVQC